MVILAVRVIETLPCKVCNVAVFVMIELGGCTTRPVIVTLTDDKAASVNPLALAAQVTSALEFVHGSPVLLAFADTDAWSSPCVPSVICRRVAVVLAEVLLALIV